MKQGLAVGDNAWGANAARDGEHKPMNLGGGRRAYVGWQPGLGRRNQLPIIVDDN
jgi:hypothetical protein